MRDCEFSANVELRLMSCSINLLKISIVLFSL